MKRQQQNPFLHTNILKPLLDVDKLKVGKTYKPNKLPPSYSSKIISRKPSYKMFNIPDKNNAFSALDKKLSEQPEGEKKLQLADFVIKQLARDDLPNSSGNLDYVHLIDDPYINEEGKRMDFYSSDLGPEQDKLGIVLSPYDAGLQDNPIIKLMHEGTHALDDLVMRTYQKNAIDTLASQEALGNIGHDKEGLQKLKALYEGTQKILGHPQFTQDYPFETFYQNIKESFEDLSDTEEVDKQPSISNFQQAQTALNSIRNRKKDRNPPAEAFLGFSEFPAFAMEQLFDPWSVNAQTNPQSREFLGNIMKGVRKNFKTMGGGKEQFSQDYPYVYKALGEKKTLLNTIPSGQPIISTPINNLPTRGSNARTNSVPLTYRRPYRADRLGGKRPFGMLQPLIPIASKQQNVNPFGIPQPLHQNQNPEFKAGSNFKPYNSAFYETQRNMGYPTVNNYTAAQNPYSGQLGQMMTMPNTGTQNPLITGMKQPTVIQGEVEPSLLGLDLNEISE